MARLISRLSDEDADDLVEALGLEGPLGSETAAKARTLGRLGPDEESPDFEVEHLNELARVLIEYEWVDPAVYADLRDEVTRLRLS